MGSTQEILKGISEDIKTLHNKSWFSNLSFNTGTSAV